MSILIRNMEMPNRCCECPMCHDYLFCRLAEKNFGEIDCIELRADWCPLIEIPPHGRLIDADALHIDHFTTPTSTSNIMQLYVSKEQIDNAPTIIESEGEE